MRSFGYVLKVLRKRHSMTQKELGMALGLSESAIGMYEREQREPDFETLENIADYFNVNMDYLTGRSLNEGPLQTFSTPGDFEREWDKLTGRSRAISSDGSVSHVAPDTSLAELYYYCKTPDEQEYAYGLLSAAHRLNEDGKQEAVKRVSELAEIPRYQKPPEDTTPGDK